MRHPERALAEQITLVAAVVVGVSGLGLLVRFGPALISGSDAGPLWALMGGLAVLRALTGSSAAGRLRGKPRPGTRSARLNLALRGSDPTALGGVGPAVSPRPDAPLTPGRAQDRYSVVKEPPDPGYSARPGSSGRGGCCPIPRVLRVALHTRCQVA